MNDPFRVHTDTPIVSMAADKYRRRRLVDIVGRQIMEVSSSDSLTVGLHAPWGTGKTSFLNLVAERLCPLDGPALHSPMPTLVRFNPWLYSSADELLRMFFAELATAIGKSLNDETDRSRIVDLLLNFSDIVATGAVAAGVAWGAIDAQDAASAVGGVATAKAGIKGASTYAAARLTKRDALAKLDSLASVKARLNTWLADLPGRVVVFIDDIDRCEPDSLRHLMKMVRLIADFSNVTYVLAYDRDVVERGLDSPAISGRDYLEKIVQVSFALPEAERGVLTGQLLEDLDTIFRMHSISRPDTERMAALYHAGLKPLAVTGRAVKRLANAVAVSLPAVHHHVDVVDFLGLILLQQACPSVHQHIAASKTLLTDFKAKDTDLKQWFDDTMLAQPPAKSRVARELTRLLFPNVAKAVGGRSHSPSRSDARREQRVVCAECFDSYFLLETPTGAPDVLLLQDFLAAVVLGTDASFDFIDTCERGVLRGLLEMLDDYYPSLTIEQCWALAEFTFLAGDELVFPERGMLDPMADLLPARIIFKLGSRFDLQSERFALLVWGLAHGALFTAIREVKFQEPERDSRSHTLVTNVGLRSTLVNVALERLNEAHRSGDLWDFDDSRMVTLLWMWRRWDKPASQRAVDEHLASDANIVSFLKPFIRSGSVQELGKPAVGTAQLLRRREVGRFANVDILLGRLSMMISTYPSNAEIQRIHDLLSADDPDRWYDTPDVDEPTPD